MTPEKFFELTKTTFEKRRAEGAPGSLYLTIWPEQRGWRADTCGCCAYGDTVEDAVQAAFDHYMGRRSKRAQWNPPYGSSVPRTLANRHRVAYDYRTTPWTPALDIEDVRGLSKRDQLSKLRK